MNSILNLNTFDSTFTCISYNRMVLFHMYKYLNNGTLWKTDKPDAEVKQYLIHSKHLQNLLLLVTAKVQTHDYCLYTTKTNYKYSYFK